MTTTSWAHIVERARSETFVGREQERCAFDQFLDDEVLRLLHISGPAGIGKTTLLQEFAHHAHTRGYETLRLDGATIDAVATAVEQAFAPALEADEETPFLVVLDNFGSLRGLHRWMHQQLLTRLPSSVRLVSAERDALPDAWLAAPGWQQLARGLELEQLSESESLELLELRGVASPRLDEVISFGQGHPLALTIAADVAMRHPEQQFDYDTAADDLQLLLRRLVGEAPSQTHRQTLKLASLVRRVTEPLLTAVLEVDHAPKLLRWLGRRPFIDVDEHGFFLHDLVRKLINDDMRRYEESVRANLLRRALDFYFGQGRTRRDDAHEEVIIDLFYLLRDDILSDWAPAEAQQYLLGEPDDEELDTCLQMVRRHEGERSAELAAYWQRKQPEGVVVLRAPSGRVAGFCHFLEVDRVEPEDAERDPAVRITRDYITDEAPLRQGETARICRYWMADDDYQDWSGVQTRMFLHIFHQVAARPGVAVGLTVHAYPEKWLDRPDNQHQAFGEFEIEDIPYVVLGNDWRTIARMDWLEKMVQAMMGQPGDTDLRAPTVLSRDEFEDAVKDALKKFHRGDRLKSNPLVDTLVVLTRCEDPSTKLERVTALRELLEEACRSLGEAGGDRHHIEVLEQAYLDNDGKGQKDIAEEYGMAYSTFRLHVRQATERVADHLWIVEQSMLGL